jgi:pimeloyl-ACP methyl ester carboxylesterase
MTGGRIDRRRQTLTVSIVVAVVLLAGVGAVVAHQLAGSTSGTPSVVQLPGPTSVTTGPPGVTPSSVGSGTSPSSPAAVGAAQHLVWKGCGGAAQCAMLNVPLDWSGTDPAARGRVIPMALIRYLATGPRAQRIGSLVVNPGGPGASGVAYVRDGLASIPAAVRARFDIVGFDPRGTGASDPVDCLTGPQLDAIYRLPPYPTDAAQTTELVAASKQEAAGCAAHTGDELKHLGTSEVAMDMDALRAALGDTTLTYLGYSYGTYLGAEYAKLFPTHIRAFVLDGAIDPTETGTQMISGQAGGFETAFDAFAAWCAGNSTCQYGASMSSAGQLEASYRQLQTQVATDPLPGNGSRTVTSGLFLEGTLVTLYDRTNGWPALGSALAQAAGGDGAYLLQLADLFLDRSANGSYDPEGEANLAVNCLDHTYPDTVAATQALATTLAAQDPTFGRAIAWSGLGCAFWPVAPQVSTAPITAPGAPPILVVATTRDPATPYAGGVALARELDSGVLLSNDGDGHTAYRSTGSTCVQGIVNSYLISLDAPSRAAGAHC